MESQQVRTDSASDSGSTFPISAFRSAYQSVSQVTYGGTVSLLLVIGGASLGAAYTLPSSRGVLLSIGATGLFGAILLGAMTPEQFVTSTLTKSLHGVSARNTSSLIEALEIAGPPRYIPTDSGVRVLIPNCDEMETPASEELNGTLIGDDSIRGLVLEPAGAGILEEFERDGGGLPDDHHTAVDILVSALVDQFDLADEITVDSIGDDHVTVRVVGSIFDDDAAVDHPIQSFFAVALANVLDSPVRTAMTETDTSDALLMTVKWGSDQ